MEDRIELVDYISIDRLQNMQDSFSMLVGVGAAISDENGSAITQSSGMCDFCKYTRVSRIGSQRCRDCDSRGAQQAFVDGKPHSYTCHAGLVDFVSPIVVDDKRVGCFVGGQVRLGEPDEEKVRQTAKDIGVNPEMYLMLAKKTPQITQAQLEKAMDFIHNVTLSISDMASKQYQLEKAKIEVEYAAKLKSDFLANMSHEIRTPMNGVIGLAELALKDNELSEQTKTYLNQIQTSGKTLLTIINDILDFSKIEAGKMNIVYEAYEPRKIIDNVVSIISKKVEDKHLKLNVLCDAGLPDVLVGDATRVQQIILNLVNNAVKFTTDGSVTVRITVKENTGDSVNMEVSVEDTGMGITEENLEKLFQSFQQVDSKRNRQEEGTGLGLAISKQLVEMMGGEINVESEYGKGSRFWFWIPQEVSDKESLEKAEEKQGGDSALFTAPDIKVLIVDDNEVNLTVAKGLLTPINMDVDTADSGKKAIAMIMDKHYDLIFMDHMMPEMDGIETAGFIRQNYPEYNEVPIIALTANVIEGSKEMFIAEGMNDCVTKPIDMKLMMAALHKWIPDEKKHFSGTDERIYDSTDTKQKEIDGLDIDYAIRMLGSEELFMTVLNDYYRVINSKADRIQELYDKEDWKNYTIEVHALKSASRQIGAIELADIAAEMEKCGNAEDTERIRECTSHMLKLYRNFYDICAPLFAEEEVAKDKKQLDSNSVLSILNSLSEAIENLDMDAMDDEMDRLLVYEYSDNQETIVAKLKDSVDRLDVDSAAELVDELKNSL